MKVNNRITLILLSVFVSGFLFACSSGSSDVVNSETVPGDTNVVPPVDNVDVTPPALSITLPSASPSYTTGSDTVTISGTATDDTGVTEISWLNDRGGSGSASGLTDWSIADIALVVGDNVITVTAKDANNNSTESVITVTYNVIDNNSPAISITSPVPNSGTVYGTDINRVSIAGTSSDNIGVARISWSNGGNSGTAIGTDPWIINDIQLSPGTNTIRVTAYDAADNSGTDQLTVNYIVNVPAETCMTCHNGAANNDYTGAGLTNPHPFAGAQNIRCTVCHGGDGQGLGKVGSHVPPPPEIGDKFNMANDPVAYFNRLTLTGIDKFPDYTVNNKTYSALDYLQFINPGDLRVVSNNRSCGICHGNRHVDWVMKSPLATEAGILSGALYSAGMDNSIPEHQGLYQDTAADVAFRAITDPLYSYDAADIGSVGLLNEFPVFSVYGALDADSLFQNNLYDANNLANDLVVVNRNRRTTTTTNQVIQDSALASLYKEQVAFTCGDCHLGSAGANNRFGDFRSSGCTACHMAYSADGRSRSTDPNVNKLEPANPDAIVAPERPHIATHLIKNVAKTLPNGEFVTGITDMTCAGCHQGSNRTVLQYWGIRLDQNQNLANHVQYPANPVNFTNTANDTRLFDPAVNNATFNGRNANQYIEFEDYDGDNRDDTPADVHQEAGLGCIDCHGSRDLHGGATGDATGNKIKSREEQVVVIKCESCHGSIEAYAPTKSCLNYDNKTAECVYDTAGNTLRHVTRDNNGNYYLISRVNGQRHFVPQTRDTVVLSNKTNPLNNQLVYNKKASYAMGRADGNVSTGLGPVQANPNSYTNGFSHTDNMDCVSCHAAWTNACVGCHLGGEYDDNPANFRFSNITGERIVYNQTNADFVYQSPVPFQLGVTADNKISQMVPAETVFYRYTDLNGNESQVFAFSDRNGNGNNPNTGGRNVFPAMGHNAMMAHSVRGKVQGNKEGPRYCVACHLTEEGLNNFGDEYDVFRTAMANNDFARLDFNLLQEHIGKNTGNQLDSPLWVHMVAGLGSGLFLFDANGCPVNPLDNDDNRQYCANGAPADNFNLNNVVYNLDRVVEDTGISNASNSSPMKQPGAGTNKRDGSLYPDLAGPLGASLIQKLTDPDTGIVLDSWLDADGQPQGNAADFVQ
ncbi:MAG: hypothetical protein LJE83_05135 [Gammaproteobacteria bacterium]|nr:hypothetical protein [Gammaproteobacteria bacterium]